MPPQLNRRQLLLLENEVDHPLTGGTAKSMATAAGIHGLMSVLVPRCVAQLIATATYNHADVVRKFVKKVLDTEMNYSFARACAVAVNEFLAKSPAKT
jgi:hypothetical protein